MSQHVIEIKNGTVRGGDSEAITRIARLRYARPTAGSSRPNRSRRSMALWITAA